MFQTNGPRTTHGFLVAIDFDDSGKANSDKVSTALADGVWHLEGLGNIHIDYLGEIELSDAAETP